MQIHGKSERDKIREQIHDIKSTLQSLLVANELVIESEEGTKSNEELLRTMLDDIKKIHEAVNTIERDVGGG